MNAAVREGTGHTLDDVPDTLIERYCAAPRGGREYRALADEIDTLFVGPDLWGRVQARYRVVGDRVRARVSRWRG